MNRYITSSGLEWLAIGPSVYILDHGKYSVEFKKYNHGIQVTYIFSRTDSTLESRRKLPLEYGELGVKPFIDSINKELLTNKTNCSSAGQYALNSLRKFLSNH